MSLPGARGPYAKTAARREEIVAASTDVFASAGFLGGSMRDIAERVGISVGGLLHHFPTKEALLEAVLDHRDRQSTEQLGHVEGLALLEGLVALARHQAQHQPGLIRLHAVLSAEATAPDHSAHEYFTQRYAVLVERFTAAFALAGRRGQVRADVDPTLAARTLVALWDGLQVQWLLDPAVGIADAMDAYLRSLLV